MGNCMDNVAVAQNKFVESVKGENSNMAPVLHYIPPSPPCRAVLLLGRMLNINFDLKVVNLMEGEHMKPEYIQINPQHTVPTLEDQGIVLWESRTIMTYLVSAYAKEDQLYPRDIRIRAIVDQRMQFDLGTLYARTAEYFFGTIWLGAALDETKKARLEEALGWLEILLKGQHWTACGNMTVADISLAVTVSQIEAFRFDLGPYPRIRAWLQRCKDQLAPYGYDEINQTGADTLAGIFRSRLK